MSAGKAAIVVIVLAAAAWAAHRKLTGQPLIPKSFATIGPVVAGGDPAAEEQQRELNENSYDPIAGLPYIEPVKERPARGIKIEKKPSWLDNLLGRESVEEAQDIQAVSENIAQRKAKGQPLVIPSETVPASIAIAAGGSAAALAVLRAKAKGAPVRKLGYSQTKSGLVKWTTNPRTGAAVTQLVKGNTVPAKVGQGPFKVPSAAPKPPLITGGSKPIPIAPKVPAVPAIAKTAARIAGKALLPVGVALGAYDLASRAQAKGAQNLDVGDVAAAITGVGGLGIRQHLPPVVRGALKTKVKDVSSVVRKAVFDAGKNVGKAVSTIAAKPPAPSIRKGEKRTAAATAAMNAATKKTATSAASKARKVSVRWEKK